MRIATYAIRPLGPLDVSDRQSESVNCRLRERKSSRLRAEEASSIDGRHRHLQPAVYTMRETSHPAPITAACTGYLVPAISSVAMKGVRFSVKLA